MRSLVVNMVGMVGVCVWGVVCLVGVGGWEGVGCVFVGRARSDSGECVLGWGAGWVGGSGEKKNLLPCGSF